MIKKDFNEAYGSFLGGDSPLVKEETGLIAEKLNAAAQQQQQQQQGGALKKMDTAKSPLEIAGQAGFVPTLQESMVERNVRKYDAEHPTGP